MSTRLHTGKVYQIEYTPCGQGMFGSDGQEALYNIMSMFDINNTASDEFAEDYEVSREELKRLRTIITEEGAEYQNCEEGFKKALDNARITKADFIDVLDHLIEKSDQRNPFVLISWIHA